MKQLILLPPLLATIAGGLLYIAQPTHTPVPSLEVTPRLLWLFEAPHPGSILAKPIVTADAVYLAAVHDQPFRRSGAVYALDPATGATRWRFDREGAMLPTASTPALADGRLFLGEGMHADFVCRLQCLNAATGAKSWSVDVAGHIEGGPTVADGTVFFPAGDDGLHAVNAKTGAVQWSFRADLHIDSTPCVVDRHVIVGSGRSRRYQTHQVVCLDAASGLPIWRTPVELPAWGSPVVAAGRVYLGLGNGRLTQSVQPPDHAAGALACLDASTGKLLWTFPVGDAVFGLPAITQDGVFFGSRDGNIYGLGFDGRERFRVDVGSPCVAGIEAVDGRLYAVSFNGRVVCLGATNGHEIWRYELGRPDAEPAVYSHPVVRGNRLFVGTEMGSGSTSIATLFCFELPATSGESP